MTTKLEVYDMLAKETDCYKSEKMDIRVTASFRITTPCRMNFFFLKWQNGELDQGPIMYGFIACNA